jgi:hypothetical protein
MIDKIKEYIGEAQAFQLKNTLGKAFQGIKF